MPTYSGPIREEPLALELHNTLYVDRGTPSDGLAGAAGLIAWLQALAPRLPVAPGPVESERLAEFVDLRTATREALHAAVEGRPIAETARAALNRWSANSPESLRLSERGSGRHFHAPTTTDVILGLIASSTIALVSGPHADDLRTCGAPPAAC